MDFANKAKMKPLVTSTQVLTWLYLYPDASSTQALKLALGVSVFTVNLANIIVSGAYSMKFATTDLGEVLYGLFEAVGFFSICYNLVIAFLSRNKTAAILKKLSDIYKQCKNHLFKCIKCKFSLHLKILSSSTSLFIPIVSKARFNISRTHKNAYFKSPLSDFSFAKDAFIRLN